MRTWVMAGEMRRYSETIIILGLQRIGNHGSLHTISHYFSILSITILKYIAIHEILVIL